MIRPSLAALAIAGASLFSCASTSAQGLAQSPQSNELASTATPQDPAKQDPALRAHKEQLEQELQALKKQQKDLNALVEKLKARANAAADEGAAAEQIAAARAKQRHDAERAEQDRREQEAKVRIERIEKRVENEIQRIKENAKKEIEKAKAEAKKGSDRDVAVVESKKPSMRAARVVPPSEQPREVVLDDVTSESAPQPMFVISEPVEGKPMEVVLQDVTEAKKPKDGQNKSPRVMRTRIVEGQPIEGRVVEGRPIAPVPPTWRETKVQPAEEDMHVFMTDENGLPGRRIEVREMRIEEDDDARGDECCDCDCPMCGKQAKARDVQRYDGPRRQEFRGRMQPRMDEMRNEARRRLDQRMEERRRDMDMRMAPRMQRNGMPEGDRFMERAMDWRNDPEVERLIEALRNRLNQRREDIAPRAWNRAEAAPAPQTEEAPIEVRRVRTKKPSNVAPVPMPPAAPQAPEHSHGQHAPLEIAPRADGGR